ncbi:TrmH family RNA methyltransferase [Anaerosolibacter carboniphilus]|uniref:TrmH family RNA methyltransferase n=1 Tax=Anaerosolibacter carboniphilus TaxID=1417629 RepID=A0A841L567_9FIRM|nr:23S rRNA (guanosine(2251)-2'-O)-methyltransferase RlmB [Anaerosolibacter carboniphilus]MBB6218252.1 TrmH family RNA methyltransferase [Anaerosolibacter carboniphilus]
MINEISSPENSIVKHARQLTKRKMREQWQEYIIEGVRIIKDALENEKSLKKILFCDELYETAGGEELLEELMQREILLYKIPVQLFKELSDTQNPQGIMALVSMDTYSIEDILSRDRGFYIILDRIQDPGNMGTIIRTADAAGADAIFITKGSVDLYNSKTIRSTMGSIFHLPILSTGNTSEIIALLKSQGVKIITTSLEGEKYYFEVDYREMCAIIVGNEANGVQQEDIMSSDILIKIPMLGKAESLNASVAASIVMYEVVRQRIG